MSQTDPLACFRVPDPSRFATTSEIRYADLDPNRHVNHAKFLVYVEECRLALRRHLNEALSLPDTLGWAVGALSIQYLRSLLHPGMARVECQPIAVGRTSFTLGYGMFDGGACAALVSSRSVCLDMDGRPTPLPAPLADWLRARLPAWN